MSFKHSLNVLTSLVVLSMSVACAARESRPAPATMVSCSGGVVRHEVDAAKFRTCNLVHGDLTVNAAELTDLSVLAGLYHVTGTLRVSNSPALDDLSGLENLTSVGALEIHGNLGLDDLAGLEGLQRAGRVEVTGNAELATLKGLDRLTATGRLEISDNGRLYTAAGLSELREVGDLVVANNRKLISLDGLRSLERARSVEIRKNPMLCGMNLLPALERVEQGVVLRSNRGISKNEVQQVMQRAGQAGSSFVAGNSEQELKAAAR